MAYRVGVPPSILKWLPGIKLRLSGLCIKPETSHQTLTKSLEHLVPAYMATTAVPDMTVHKSLTSHFPETRMG